MSTMCISSAPQHDCMGQKDQILEFDKVHVRRYRIIGIIVMSHDEIYFGTSSGV